MLIKRRKFLKMSGLASASLFLPKILKAFEQAGPGQLGEKILVVIQFTGGNDGLNTVIPISNNIYYENRPTLGIKKTDAIRLNTEAGLNPNLEAVAELYHQGDLAILNSVGYSNPDRSHFRSMDIWQSASKSSDYIDTGWIGRYIEQQKDKGAAALKAIEMDDVLSLALKGSAISGLAAKDPARLYRQSVDPFMKSLVQNHSHEDETVEYLYSTLASTMSHASDIYRNSLASPSKAAYPSTEFGRNLKTIASLINSDISTKVYYVSIGSFDTHFNQKNRQDRLLKEFNDGLKTFVADLKSNNRFNDVLIMTFSEFGRRVKQNASNGTDHGTANNMFFIGGGLKQKGLLNEMPDLARLTDGDLVHKVDFKQVYATILEKWLHADAAEILNEKFGLLNFI